MKKSTKRIIALSLTIIAFVISGWVDASNTTSAPEYTVVCDQGNMCNIINVDGVTIDTVDVEIATENEFFSKPENVKLWVG